ncbi:MAG: aspartyl/glutamyl-tRNA amidotransferase subunit B [Elusimicrobia bacterium CG1_02_37_114]|nr:MAG: aspartyl/glutamyl-tRNA amidotransferase subunit B [Elusimicrobia bacterium CG1_02_37_114]
MKYKPVIGLEVHVQLKTNSKLFCPCPSSATGSGDPPNTNICPVCTGQPGVLPVLNKRAVEMSIKTALALTCHINNISVFARKNYFYPDLPKNYQISQYEQPLAENGYLEINENPPNSPFDKGGIKRGIKKKIRIKRVHLEEDAGKLLHAIGSQELSFSLVDFNRTGVPLMEIVSEPDIDSPESAVVYLSTLKSMLQYLDVSDCDMEKGFLRCDANISVIPEASPAGELGTKSELKNMNSFKAIRDALEFEFHRQAEVLGKGEKVMQETRLWNPKKEISEPMRTKEEAHDYRYFPEPDLVPLEFSPEFIEGIRKTITELPEHRKERFLKEFGLSEYDANILTSEKSLADYYEECLKDFKTADLQFVQKPVANWIITELLGRLNAANKSIKESPVSSNNVVKLIKLIQDNTISGRIAKTVFDEMFISGKSPEDIVKEKGLVQVTDEKTLTKIIEEVIKEKENVVNDYKSGKKQALSSLIGAVMKKTQGKANPQVVNKILHNLLDRVGLRPNRST